MSDCGTVALYPRTSVAGLASLVGEGRTRLGGKLSVARGGGGRVEADRHSWVSASERRAAAPRPQLMLHMATVIHGAARLSC